MDQLPVNVFQFPSPRATPPAPPTFGLGQAVLLKVGDRGPKVVELQTRLQQVGADPQGADGVFGPNTERAVKHFKTAFALANPDSSAVDQVTWDKLVEATPQVPASTLSTPVPTTFWGRLMALPMWQKLLLGSGVLLVVGWGLTYTARSLGGVAHCPRLTPPDDANEGEIVDADFERVK